MPWLRDFRRICRAYDYYDGVFIYAILLGIRLVNTPVFLILRRLYAYTPFLTVGILLVAESKSDTFETSDILAIACNIRGICNAVFILILLYP